MRAWVCLLSVDAFCFVKELPLPSMCEISWQMKKSSSLFLLA